MNLEPSLLVYFCFPFARGDAGGGAGVAAEAAMEEAAGGELRRFPLMATRNLLDPRCGVVGTWRGREAEFEGET